MKKRTKIILGIFLVLAAIAVCVGVWQWNNLKALQYLATMDKSQLQENISQNDKILQSVMDDYKIASYEFSQEELDALENGDMSMDQAIDKLLGEIPEVKEPTAPQQAPETTDNTEKTEPSSQGDQKPEDNIQESQGESDNSTEIQAQVARMYVLKAKFVSRLESIVSSAQSEFDALPSSEKTGANKQRIISSKIGELSSLEGQCDSEVAEVVSQLRSLLKQSGKDVSLADQVQQVYEQEKSLKKAYYISEMQ